MNVISAASLIQILQSTGSKQNLPLIIDVRSEGEYEAGSFPGSVNIPILNNHERHQVGLTYKKEGQEVAIELGHRLVTPHKSDLIKRWAEVIKASSENRAFVFCWRGGLRSKIACQWMSDAGLNVTRIECGFKALRSKLIEDLNQLPSMVILTGMTGAGKTLLLHDVQSSGFPALDLEMIAKHRGSSFGNWIGDPQPSQVNFENQLSFEMGFQTASQKKFLERDRPVLIEDESRMIGKLVLPENLKERMGQSPIIILESDLATRIKNTFIEYVQLPSQKNGPLAAKQILESSLFRIQKKLGGAAYQQINDLMIRAFQEENGKLEAHAPWIELLFTQYYDKMYAHAFQRQERRVLFRGNHNECLDWIKSQWK